MKIKIEFKYLYIFIILSTLLSGCGSGGGGSSSNNSNNITVPPKIEMNFKKSDTVVGVIDTSFSYFDEFKDPSGNYRIFIDDSFDADPQKKLNNTYTHGELVSLLIGGNKTGVSDKIGIYAIPAYLTEGGKIKFQASMYEKMYQAGVRIFSQSFGNPSYGITKENYPVASGIVDFYVNKASTDSLFIFAAGNTGDFNPTAEALLPKFYPKAEKGWLAVVGLDPSTGKIHRDSSRAGEAMNWTITASFVAEADKVYNGINYHTTAFGTSFSAPVVAGAAGAIQVKYPWMSRDLIRQSLLTTATDLGDVGVDNVYGWGYLNLEKALKGPAVFDKRLTFDNDGNRIDNVIIDMNGYPTSSENIANYTFANDISGDAGVIKKGTGTLWFTGNNTYSGQTTIQDGALVITNNLNSNVVLENNGILRAVGVVSPLGITERVVTINGNIKNNSTSTEGLSISYGGLKINGDYTGNNNSSISIDITSNLEVTGTFDNGNGKINVTYGTKSIPISNIYMTKDIVTAELIKNTIPENINTVPINNYFDFQNITVTDNKISLDYKRNSTEYVVKSLGMTSHSAVNTALNLENSFTVAEKNDSFLKAASGILATPNALLPRTIDSLSAEIYASSQNLIFKQLKEMNRDLSNRVALVSENRNDNLNGIFTLFGL